MSTFFTLYKNKYASELHVPSVEVNATRVEYTYKREQNNMQHSKQVLAWNVVSTSPPSDVK